MTNKKAPRKAKVQWELLERRERPVLQFQLGSVYLVDEVVESRRLSNGSIEIRSRTETRLVVLARFDRRLNGKYTHLASWVRSIAPGMSELATALRDAEKHIDSAEKAPASKKPGKRRS